MRFTYVLRRLARTPGFTAIAALTLAIGIGANSAVFSVIYSVLLKPLPYAHPEELIDLNHTAPGVNFPNTHPAPFLYFTYREQGRAFQSLGLYRFNTQTVTGVAEPEEAPCLNVTSEVLPMLGVPPALGRWFSAKDDEPSAAKTMVLADGWWRARFGGDPSVIGRRIVVAGVLREVIGVMPPGFRLLDRDAAFLVPLQLDRSQAVLGQFDYPGIARLKRGVTLSQASSDIARMIPIALHSFPPQSGFTVKEFEDVRLAPKLRTLTDKVIGDIGATLWVVMGTIGLVLLIACANIANLLLVRAEGRQHELAVRAALGAGGRDLARELLTESVLLGLLGGAIGLGFAWSAVQLLVWMAPSHLPRLHEIAIDPAVVLFTLGTSLVAGTLFGLIPAIKYARPEIAMALRGGGRAATQGREQLRVRGGLVVVQVALAVVLLVGSGLMIRTFQALRRVDPGFDPRDVLTLRITIPASQVRDATATVQLEQGILEKMRALPGVTAAGLTSVIPTEPGVADVVYARDKTYSRSVPPLRRVKYISPGLLAAMGSRLVAGREFTWEETYQRRPVAMVSENLARELWQDPRNAIGKQIRENLTGPWRELVGVVNDVHEDGMQAAAPALVYYPVLMNNFQGSAVAVRRSAFYVVRSRRAASPDLLAELQRATWSLSPSLPLANVRTLEEIYEASLARTSFTLVMLAVAGAMALLIGVVGIYGVISYSVSQRTREIGIRMALGASRRELVRMFIGRGVVLAAIGVGCGVGGAIALTRVLATLLFGVSAFDPATYAVVAAGLLAAAASASAVPARRASAIDPGEALRDGIA